jgi:hypothetical protein
LEALVVPAAIHEFAGIRDAITLIVRSGYADLAMAIRAGPQGRGPVDR